MADASPADPPPANPVLVEVTRGGTVESRHRGALAIADVQGLRLEVGDTQSAIFPRSAVKLIQALPLVETGAAEAFAFDQRALALACASHNGEPEHVATAVRMLAATGLDPSDLACGAHLPTGSAARRALVMAGRSPGREHNNCSGKHAGMLAVARHLGETVEGYERTDHPVQQRVRAVFEDVCGVGLAAAPCGIDGCGLPNWAMPLDALAQGYARLATGAGLVPARAAAAQRLAAAAMAEPFMTAGTGRFCTEAMQALPGRLYVKTGAEGVFCGLVPALGVGFALKIDDGGTRASEVVAASVAARLLDLPLEAVAMAKRLTIRNWSGTEVGTVRPAAALTAALADLRGAAPT